MFLTACNDFEGMRTATADVKSNEGKKIQCTISRFIKGLRCQELIVSIPCKVNSPLVLMAESRKFKILKKEREKRIRANPSFENFLFIY